jgi:hypothetical protein
MKSAPTQGKTHQRIDACSTVSELNIFYRLIHVLEQMFDYKARNARGHDVDYFYCFASRFVLIIFAN